MHDVIKNPGMKIPRRRKELYVNLPFTFPSEKIRFLFFTDFKCKPASDIEIGHRSTSASLLGNISLKVKQRIEWDGKKERILGNVEADKLLSKQYRSPWKLA